MKTLFGLIWGIWGALCFALVVTLFTPLYALILAFGGKSYARKCVWINCRYLSPLLLGLFGIRWKVVHPERAQFEGACVFVSNHLAQIDILCNAAASPKPMKFLAKKEIAYIPFFGFMVKMLGIFVDRKDKASREKSMEYMVKALQEGDCIFIYPEGSRNRSNELLKEFKSGAFRLAIQAQVPVVIQTLINTGKLNDPRGFSLYPGAVEIHFCETIDTRGMTLDDVDRLSEMVKDRMLSVLKSSVNPK